MYTLIALRSCVADADIPLLMQMLSDRDHVVPLAAANVLVDTDARMLIRDALQEANAPEQRALKDYPGQPSTARCRRSPWPGSRPA